jgi:hypothetical protein
MSDASSTLTPERLAEIERDAARRLREPWLYPLSPSVTLALCAALRAAWAERDRLRCLMAGHDRHDDCPCCSLPEPEPPCVPTAPCMAENCPDCREEP